MDAAVLQVLRTKASLGLRDSSDMKRPLPDPVEERAWRDRIASESITLVKDQQHLLPIEPERHRRVLVHAIQDVPTFYDPTADLAVDFADRLTARGMDVTLRRAGAPAMT